MKVTYPDMAKHFLRLHVDRAGQLTIWPIYEAKTQLSALVERAAAGEEIVIAKAGRPRAKLVAVGPSVRRRAGKGRGTVWMADDFDAPLPPEVLDGFEGTPKK